MNSLWKYFQIKSMAQELTLTTVKFLEMDLHEGCLCGVLLPEPPEECAYLELTCYY